jgi:hypothetical protein
MPRWNPIDGRLDDLRSKVERLEAERLALTERIGGLMRDLETKVREANVAKLESDVKYAGSLALANEQISNLKTSNLELRQQLDTFIKQAEREELLRKQRELETLSRKTFEWERKELQEAEDLRRTQREREERLHQEEKNMQVIMSNYERGRNRINDAYDIRTLENSNTLSQTMQNGGK